MEEKEVYYQKTSENGLSGADAAGSVNSDMNSAASQTHYDKFNAAQGHGYAAEQANNLYDLLTGNDAKIVGGDNAKNGADRCVNNMLIQTKYCQNASLSISAAFENGQYRYLNADGTPMQLEVPADQYTKAVELMEKRISDGQVPGITDPEDAHELVRRGHFTYEQAVNIAKFGTVESLAYDAANGAVVASSAFGITAVLTFARSLWNGESVEVAIERAAYSGIQIGGAAFISSVISAQLMRTFVGQAMAIPSEAIVGLLGKNTSLVLANTLKSGANVYGATAMSDVDKLLRGNLLTAAIMTLVLSSADIHNAFRGRISGKQLFKNISIRAGSMAGAVAGAQVGLYALNVIAPGVGTAATIIVSIAGSVAGGTVGGKVTNTVIGEFIEDDAVEMVRIIENTFCRLAQDYLLSEDEVEILLSDISRVLEGETLLDMFASADRFDFAEQLLRECIERLVRGRCRIILPSEADFIRGIGRLTEDVNAGRGLFAASASRADAVAIGRMLTGKDLPENVAKKAWYATRQMNTAQSQVELLLNRMAADERETTQKLQAIHSERDELKAELNMLLNHNE